MYHSMVGKSGRRPACTSANARSSEASTSRSSGKRWIVGPHACACAASPERHENFGRPRSARFTFIVVPSRRYPSMRRLYASGRSDRVSSRSRMRNGSALHTTVAAPSSRPSSSATPRTAPPSTRIRVTRWPVSIAAPAARAASPMRAVTVPMPPRTSMNVPSEPGRRHMLWTRKFIPVPGVLHVPVLPEKPSVTAYIARRRSLRKSKRAR